VVLYCESLSKNIVFPGDFIFFVAILVWQHFKVILVKKDNVNKKIAYSLLKKYDSAGIKISVKKDRLPSLGIGPYFDLR